jgi:hypothetical protein
MYAWVWRQLPGPALVRVLIAVLLFVAVVVALFVWVFPWVEPRLPFTDVTVDESASAASAKLTGLGWTP